MVLHLERERGVLSLPVLLHLDDALPGAGLGQRDLGRVDAALLREAAALFAECGRSLDEARCAAAVAMNQNSR